MREWRNGRRAGFRCQCPLGRGGSTPLSRTMAIDTGGQFFPVKVPIQFLRAKVFALRGSPMLFGPRLRSPTVIQPGSVWAEGCLYAMCQAAAGDCRWLWIVEGSIPNHGVNGQDVAVGQG